MLLALPLVLSPAAHQDPAPAEPEGLALTADDVRTAGRVIGIEYTDEELELMLRDVASALEDYAALRADELANSVPPALIFSPLLPGIEPAPPLEEDELADSWPGLDAGLVRPPALEDLAYSDISSLAHMIRTGEVTCVELTEMYLARLRRLDAELHCVITFTEERALEQARELDKELAEGKYRGPLHGIPWGAKDLLSVGGYPTTWGARPFEEQVIDLDATVVRRLDEAGAVLIAKLSLGALAWGDAWYGGRTRNPWNTERGSSGSSAGSASATAAGCVAFAIGSETLGSIVSPSAECGNSSLRPTFGRVSRHGAMALSWSMDKLGPICRSVEDAAIVLAAIAGPDREDPTAVDLPATVPVSPERLEGWRIGYLPKSFEREERLAPVLDDLRALGVELVPVEFPAAPGGVTMTILNAEAACAFDELTRSGRDDLLVRQVRNAWPNVFRTARLVPAVEYLRANRLRTLLCQDVDRMFREAGVVAVVHPSFGNAVLSTANLTGHPTVVAPAGFGDSGRPFSVSFTGRLFDESRLLALAGAWQRATGHHLQHPEL
jgi:Asp-tRNA(Asn)/Glu-tRNA(Gln) amidotransferase A subunit family amidase